MMADAVAETVPTDIKGRPVSLDVIKEFLAQDVLAIRAAVRAIEADAAACECDPWRRPSPVLRRVLHFLERAHDRHWEWYAAAKGS